MNCKQGELAIITSKAGNLGLLVETIEFMGEHPTHGTNDFGPMHWHKDKGPCWLVKTIGSPLKFWDDKCGWVEYPVAPYPDKFLRPIRPGELEDETEDSRELECI
jgi:hypothetical protein